LYHNVLEKLKDFVVSFFASEKIAMDVVPSKDGDHVQNTFSILHSQSPCGEQVALLEERKQGEEVAKGLC